MPPVLDDRYELREQLGRGAFGEVWRARDRRLGRDVAVKLLVASSEQARRRFQREQSAISRLRHPGIVAVHDSGEVAGRPYFVMELVEGQTFQEACASRALSRQRGLEVVLEVAQALQHAHQQGVLHRDLKPSNVLVDLDGHARVLDFGLAFLESEARLTRTGGMAGTPAYMAPEQFQGRATDARADVYGLGGLLLYLLVGEPPRSPDAQGVATAWEAPVPPSARLRGIPPELDRLALRCLQPDPARRYASAAEVAQALERFLRADSSSAPGRKPPLAAIAALLVLLGLGAAAGVLLAGLQSPPPPPTTPASPAAPPPTPSPQRLELWTAWDPEQVLTYRYRQDTVSPVNAYRLEWEWHQRARGTDAGQVHLAAEISALAVELSSPGMPTLRYDTRLPDESQTPMFRLLRRLLGAEIQLTLNPTQADFLLVQGFTALPQRLGPNPPPWVQQVAPLWNDGMIRTILNVLCRHLPPEPLQPGQREWSRTLDLRSVGVNAQAEGSFHLRALPEGERVIEWRVAGDPRWEEPVPPQARYSAHGLSRWRDGRLIQAEATQELRLGQQRQHDEYRLELVEAR